MRDSSTVGISAAYICASCGETHRMFQVLKVADPTLDLPRGWKIRNGRIYCQQHLFCRIASQRPVSDATGHAD